MRTTLQEQGESVPNHAGKPTQRPTMRRRGYSPQTISLLVTLAPAVASALENTRAYVTTYPASKETG